MPTIPPELVFPYGTPRRRRRSLMLGRFGLVPLPPVHIRACPQIVQYIPPGCTAQVSIDANGCPVRTPVCPPGAGPAFLGPPITPQTPPPISPSSPVPANFPTNQIFVAPDGSQWIYSAFQGQWISEGVPFNVSAPPAAPVTAAPAVTTVPAPPVSVTVAPSTAATPSPYQSIIDFATQDSLISGIPNWIVGIVGFFGYKLLEEKFASGGRR